MKTTPYAWMLAAASALSDSRWHRIDSAQRLLAVALFAGALATYIGLVLIGGQRTFANTMAHDTLLLIDGAYRLLHGALPHIDFISPLGILNFAGPALFSGADIMLSVARYAGAVAVFCTLLATYAATSRLNLPLALIFILFVAVLTAAPSAIGYPPDHISFAMVYNRQSYAFLLLLVILALPRTSFAHRITPLLDTALITAALLFLLHTKITFFGVAAGLCAVIFVAAAHLRRALIVAAAVVIATMLAVTLWQPDFYVSYARDLIDASLSRASDGAGNQRHLMMRLDNSKAEWMLALIVTYMVWCERHQLGRQRALLTVLLYLAVIGCAIPLILLNSQLEGLILTTALFVHAAMLFYNSWQQQRSPRNTFNYFFTLACTALFALSYSIPKAGALDRYKRYSKHVQYEFSVPSKLANFIAHEQKGSALAFAHKHALTLSPQQLEDLFALIDSHQEIPQNDYIHTIAAGTFLLQSVVDENGPACVINFDFANPFNVLLELPICKHDYLWMQPYVNVSPEHFAPAEQVLADAGYITVPKLPALRDTAELVQRIYGDYLVQNFDIVAESDLWQIWQRKKTHIAER